jgi:hypothetical protein
MNGSPMASTNSLMFAWMFMPMLVMVSWQAMFMPPLPPSFYRRTP